MYSFAIKLSLERNQLIVSTSSSDGMDERGEQDWIEMEEDDIPETKSDQIREILLPWETEVTSFYHF